MAVKKSFVLYHDSREQIEMLSDEQAGKLIKALMRFSETGEELDCADPMVKMTFSFMSAQIRRDAEKYEATCQKRSANGKKGGAPKGNQNASKTSKTSKCFSKQAKQAKQADSDSDSVSENDSENDTDTVCDSVNVKETTRTATHVTHAVQQQMTVPEVLALASRFGYHWDEEEARRFLAYNIDKGRNDGWSFAVQCWEAHREERTRRRSRKPSASRLTQREAEEMNEYLSVVNRFKEDDAS